MRHILLVLMMTVLAAPVVGQHKYFEMNPPKIKELQKRRSARLSPMLGYKVKGYLGENDKGFISIRDISKASKAEQEKIKKFVDDENADRKVMFQEIISYNKMNKDEQGFLIKATFETFKNTDPKGTYHYVNKKWEKRYK